MRLRRIRTASLAISFRNGSGRLRSKNTRIGCSYTGTPAALSAVNRGPSPPTETVGCTPCNGNSRVQASSVRDVLPRSRLFVHRRSFAVTGNYRRKRDSATQPPTPSGNRAGEYAPVAGGSTVRWPAGTPRSWWSENSTVFLDELLNRPSDVELRCARSCARLHLGTVLRFTRQPADCLRHRLQIVVGHHDSAITHHLCHGAARIRHDRAAASHRFEQGHSERLIGGGTDADIPRMIQRLNRLNISQKRDMVVNSQ